MKDKSGKPVEGLTAKDFTVTEDGVPQTIRFFEFQKLPETARGRAARYRVVRAAATSFPQTQIAPERPGDIALQDRRLLALYFDMTAMPPPDQLRALDAAREVHPDADDAGRPAWPS